MKIAIMTDAHGNLPALKAVLAAVSKEGCDAIYHTGDAIGIGPFPSECLDLLLNTPRMHLIMGNHDVWFAFGLPDPQPPWMSDGELVHQHWIHARLDSQLRSVVRKWPFMVQEMYEGFQIAFAHYGLTESGTDFASIIRGPEPVDMDRLFGTSQSSIVFYGHQHQASDLQGQARYVNPGSLGCHEEPVARLVILELGKQGYHVRKHGVPYDDELLKREFERRKVPEREFISRAFFGGRLAK